MAQLADNHVKTIGTEVDGSDYLGDADAVGRSTAGFNGVSTDEADPVDSRRDDADERETRGLYGKGGAATAGCRRIRVANNELGALQVFLIVDLRTHEVLHAHWINNQSYAEVLNLAVTVFDLLVEGESVLKSRTTAAGDEHPKL